MTTTVTKVISSSGGDFTTLQAWEDSFPASLVTADQAMVGEMVQQNFSASSGTLLTFSGTTTDATRNITLQCVSGASFVDNAGAQTNALRFNTANGASLASTASYASVISIATNNVRLQGLQVQLVAAGGGSAAVGGGTATGTDINQCIIESNHGASNLGVVSLFGSSVQIRNSLVVCRGSAQTCIALLASGAQAYNCTFAVPHDLTSPTSLFNGSYGAATVTNCALFGGNTNVSSGGSAPVCTTCVGDGFAFTGVTVVGSTGSFVDVNDATRDYRLKAGSDCANVGTTDSTHAATDIVGTARPQGSAYDVGCWEFIAAGGGGFFGRPYYDMIGAAHV